MIQSRTTVNGIEMAGFAIVVVNHGIVYVGDIEHEGDWCRIYNAKNIRTWEAIGLGRLAQNGPKRDMVDFVGTIYVPTKAIISLIDTEKEKWCD